MKCACIAHGSTPQHRRLLISRASAAANIAEGVNCTYSAKHFPFSAIVLDFVECFGKTLRSLHYYISCYIARNFVRFIACTKCCKICVHYFCSFSLTAPGVAARCRCAVFCPFRQFADGLCIAYFNYSILQATYQPTRHTNIASNTRRTIVHFVYCKQFAFIVRYVYSGQAVGFCSFVR